MVYSSRSVLRGAGHVAGAMGHYQLGHILRGLDSLGVGSEMTKLVDSIGGMAAAVPVAAAALGGLAVASKLVSVGFGAVAQTAMSFVGAISQLGGARGLESMIIETGGSERMAADIAANAADRVEARQVLNVLQNISSNTEFTKEEAGTMARAFLGKRGSFSEFEQLKDFIPNLASVATLTPQQAGAIVGQLRVQFPEMSMGQTKEAAMSLWSMGKAGAVELKDTESITQALGFARAVSPNLQAGLNLEAGMTQLAQRFTGGGSAAQAVTGVRRMQEQMLLPGNAHKDALMRSFFGQDYLAHDESGRAVLRNAPRDFAKLAYGAFSGNKSMEGVFESRGLKAIRGFVEGDVAQQFKGKSEKERIDILEGIFRKMEETGSHLEEFNGALKIVQDTAEYQLKQAFNTLANELEGELLKIMPELTSAVKNVVSYLVNHKDKIGKSLQEFVTGVLLVAKVLPPLASVALIAAQTIAKAILIFGRFVGLQADTINTLVNVIKLDPKKIATDAATDASNAIKGQAPETVTFGFKRPAAPSTYEDLPGAAHAGVGKSHADRTLEVLEAIRRNAVIQTKHVEATANNTRKNPQPPSISVHGI